MAVRSVLLSRYFLEKKKKSTLNLLLQGRGDTLTTHTRTIASQKRLMLWKEHLEKWMFGHLATMLPLLGGFIAEDDVLPLRRFPYLYAQKKRGKRMFF